MKKTFDCVEMKRKAQERIFEEIKDMTMEEELRYWQKQGELLRKEMEVSRIKRTTESATQ